MTQEHNKPNTVSAIEKIKSGSVKMRPKWHFVVYGMLFFTGSAIALVTLLYLASFIIFMSRVHGIFAAPYLGLRGISIFVTSLPWILIGLTILFIVLLEVMVRHYAFAYRQPLLYSLFGILILVLGGGFMVSTTQLHPQLLSYAEKKQLPIAGPLYRQYGHKKFKHIHQGIITSTTTVGFILNTKTGEVITVIISPKTQLPANANFNPGERILIFGSRDKEFLTAFGIHRIRE